MAIYLDNAATSFPKPPRVYDTLRLHVEKYGACPGRGSYGMARDAEGVVDKTRELLAELFRIQEPSRIAFTLNATDALNMAIKGTLCPGDHVVTSVFEHNSVMRPLNGLEQKGIISVTRISGSKEGLIDPDEVLSAITERTKLVAVIHGSNVTGALQPIATIGGLVRKKGILFLLDAAQTAGAVPINVEDDCIDLLAFPGHKALLGLPGTGALYVGSRVKLQPWREGGTGVLSELPLQPQGMPYLLEAGSPNTLGIAGLHESIQFILQYGVGWIRSHELSLIGHLLDRLKEDERFIVYGPIRLEDRVAVVSLNIQGCAPSAVADFLDSAHGIAVRSGLHCAPGAHKSIGTFPNGTVRISPGYFNTLSDVDSCLEALSDAASKLPKSKLICVEGS